MYMNIYANDWTRVLYTPHSDGCWGYPADDVDALLAGQMATAEVHTMAQPRVEKIL